MAEKQKSFGTPWTLLALFFILACCIGAAGYFSYLDQKKRIRNEKQKELLAVADLKSRTIALWRGNHFDDARVIANNPLLVSLIERWIRAGAPPSSSTEKDILIWMTGRQRYYHYSLIVLFDPRGKPLLYAPRNAPCEVTQHERDGISQAALIRKPIFSDLYRKKSSGEILADIFVPFVVSGNDREKTCAVLMIRDDLHHDLFPLVQSWPTPSRTAESLLIRRDGNRIIFLNELRHRKNNALQLDATASDRYLVAAKAVRGAEGIVEGLDYRGVPVIAAVKKINNSPWYLIAKIDAEEVYGTISQRAWLLGVMTVLLILVAGVGVFLIWRQAQLGFFRERYEADQQHLALAQRFEGFTRHANEAILLMDDEGNILEANERAIDWYGYSRDEFLRLSVSDLCPPESTHLVKTHFVMAWSLEGVVFEAAHRRKCGTSFPVEVSSRVVRIGGSWYYQSIIRDISERKAVERELRQQQLKLESLNRTLEERVREEVDRNRKKDHLLIHQSRLAAMGEMIGNIAHQWRQPLNVVGLLFQSLPEAYHNGELTEETLEETVDQAMEVITYMSRTMNDFRNFFKPAKERKEFLLHEIIDQSLSFLQPHFNYHDIEFSLSINRDLRATGYPNEYSQVLINILGNAKDIFLEREVTNPKITISASKEDGRSIVTIGDNGGGIREPVIDRIFEPYFTSKRGTEGTGLGLYMSKIIIEKNMQGSLTARNTAEGAEFRIVV
ncbi:MAG TPA: PAS domain S-box protein [Geobacteraceae bacterium]|nr:PAS domain S-box protein [Geobacteraceae bacterium]